MASDKRFLDDVYGLDSAERTRALYEDWAGSYDEEVGRNGYASPDRAAAALAASAADPEAPLLDLGCGTGLSGEAFARAGFTTIDGTDFSGEMLSLAHAKGVYRRLVRGDLEAPIPFSRGEYANVAAVGVFSPGHAPAEMIARVVDLLDPGGCFVFSLNDHALEDASFMAQVRSLEDDGKVETVFSEYGEHLPGRGLGAVIHVIRRR